MLVFNNKMIASFDIGEKNFCFCIAERDKIIKWELLNVMKKKSQTIIESCQEISIILFQYKDILEKCSHVLIEQQMRKNIRATRIGQHVWSWFSLILPDLKIQFFPAYMKTRFFLGKNTLNNKQRKTWAVEKACEILQARNDIEHLNYLKSSRKKDDLADTLLQLIVFQSVGK
jgi:hypothetical protein